MATAPFLPFDVVEADADGADAPPEPSGVVVGLVEPAVLLPLVPVPVPVLDPLAADWNAAKDLFAVGLTAKTIP